MALASLPRPGCAEEMAQEAFIALGVALLNGAGVELHLAFRPRGQRSSARTQAFSRPSSVSMDEIANPAARLSHNALQEKSSHDEVRRAVLALPVRYREPVVLFYLHDMDLMARPASMGLPEGTDESSPFLVRALSQPLPAIPVRRVVCNCLFGASGRRHENEPEPDEQLAHGPRQDRSHSGDRGGAHPLRFLRLGH